MSKWQLIDTRILKGPVGIVCGQHFVVVLEPWHAGDGVGKAVGRFVGPLLNDVYRDLLWPSESGYEMEWGEVSLWYMWEQRWEE